MTDSKTFIVEIREPCSQTEITFDDYRHDISIQVGDIADISAESTITYASYWSTYCNVVYHFNDGGSTAITHSICRDTDNSGPDNNSKTCADYRADPNNADHTCDGTNNGSGGFDAASQCCECGGGNSAAPYTTSKFIVAPTDAYSEIGTYTATL